MNYNKYDKIKKKGIEFVKKNSYTERANFILSNLGF